MEEPESHSATASAPPCFVIVYNVSKKHNIGTLARSAAAFGVKEVLVPPGVLSATEFASFYIVLVSLQFCLVGSNKYNTFGAHGAVDFLTLKHFSTLKECCSYLTNHYNCEIVGIEIDESAERIDSESFSGSTAFMVGNEGSGLNALQREVCDRLMYIPQFGPGTASLNVSVACGIALHRFTSWARYPERPREGEKFTVGTRPQRKAPRGVVPLTPTAPPPQHSPVDGYQSDRSESGSGGGNLSGLS